MKPLSDMGKFATVVVDPPWPITPLVNAPPANGRTYRQQPKPYDTMSISEISDFGRTLPLADDAFVFCWTIRRFLPDTFPILAAWGLTYRFTMVWHKSKGPQLPNSPSYNAEFVVVGVKGNPQFTDTKAFRVANTWPSVDVHSCKPEGFYDLLRRVTPGPRLDVFGRRRIAGFHSWGDEAPESEPEPDHYQMVLA